MRRSFFKHTDTDQPLGSLQPFTSLQPHSTPQPLRPTGPFHLHQILASHQGSQAFQPLRLPAAARLSVAARLLAVALILLPFFSCHKEVSIENTKGLAGDFRAQINGVQWVAADSTRGATILAGMINITGISSDHKQLSITLDDTIPGNYVFSQSSTSLATYADIDSSDLYAFTTNQGTDTTQAGGLVTVTNIDLVHKTITGTFSFKVYRDIDGGQKVITAGVFNQLPYTSSLPAATSKDTITAQIDGGSWTGQSIVASAVSNQLGITGSALNGNQAVSLIMPVNIIPGSYTLDYTAGLYIGLYNPTSTVSLAAASGTLQVLENDGPGGRIRGTFQYQATDPLGLGNAPHQISNGYFSVLYQ